jgi:AAA15 family ATPase/GTPase
MITKLRIRNFRSLRDVEMNLQQINLLIGPNNSGKSNLLKALEFFGNCYYEKFNKNLIWKKLFESQLFRRKRENHDDKNLTMNIHGSSNLYIDFLEEKDKEGRTIGGFTANTIDEIHEYEEIIGLEYNEKFINHDLCETDYLISYLKDLKIYYPKTDYLKTPFLFDKSALYLDSECFNLPSFLMIMKLKDEEIFHKIEMDLNKCISIYKKIKIEPFDFERNFIYEDIFPKKFSYLKKDEKNKSDYFRFGLETIDKEIFWSDELSDGVLYFLALLSIVHQPNPPKLLLLEEPETNIHPRRIREIIELIFNLANQREDLQIIMTTHSPLVVDMFKEMPESVHIFDMENGETKVQNLKTKIDYLNNKAKEAGFYEFDYTKDLAENWMIGLLDGVPDARY